MKPGILIVGRGSSDWVGGLYYTKNIAFMLSQNTFIKKNYNIYIIVDKENRSVFDGMQNEINILLMPSIMKKIDKFYRVLILIRYNIKYIFPCATRIDNFLSVTGISWIPDFQHNRLQSMFSPEEIDNRVKFSKRIIENGNPLVLSSNDCKNDANKYYGRKDKIAVVPFVSFIENDILELTQEKEADILNKYNLASQKYIYVANQFWKHKNHIVVIEAINRLINSDTIGTIKIVFTGKLRDPRNPEFIESISSYFKDEKLNGHLSNLGFIDRIDQIVIMKNAKFIIQPSLFEGWGTVVEDAKVLDKTILLSDIPVHREQMNEKCILFDPYNPDLLAELIYQESQKEHFDDIDKGIADMHKRAKEYSMGFEELLKILENKR